MDITKIEMILCALDLGSFSKAAEIYSYTPSAMTHIADSLEEEIGAKFIKRTHSGIETENEEIVEALRNICNIKNEICGIAKKEASLTIATYSSVSKYLLPDTVKKFCTDNPDTHINIIVVNTLVDLMNCGADILIGDRIPSSGYEAIKIMEDPFVAIFPKSKQGYTEFKTDTYYPETFILSNDTKTVENIQKELFDDVIAVSSHDDGPIIQMVKAEMGISMLPLLSVAGNTDEINVLTITPPISRTLWLFYRKNCKNKNIILQFANYLKGQKNLHSI